MNVLGLSHVEWYCVCRILPYVKSKIDVRNFRHVMGYLALSVKPNEFIINCHDIGQALRTVLERYLWLIKKIPSLSKNIVFDDTVEQIDVFTSCQEGPLFLAKTETDAFQKEFLGTLDSWTYHVLLNGPLHPMTRRPIQQFSQLIHSSCTPSEVRLLDCLQVSSEVQKALEMSLRESMAEPNKIEYNIPQLFEFEEAFGIPDERSLSSYLLRSYFRDLEEPDIDEDSLRSSTQSESELSVYEAIEDQTFANGVSNETLDDYFT
jgi:hypothetical protein